MSTYYDYWKMNFEDIDEVRWFTKTSNFLGIGICLVHVDSVCTLSFPSLGTAQSLTRSLADSLFPLSPQHWPFVFIRQKKCLGSTLNNWRRALMIGRSVNKDVLRSMWAPVSVVMLCGDVIASDTHFSVSCRERGRGRPCQSHTDLYQSEKVC